MTGHFTVAYGCVLVAALLPIVCAGIAKAGKFNVSRESGGYDNQDPRAWLARQTFWRSRANAAQANTFEALPFFFAAIVIAHQIGAPQTLLDTLAVIWVTLRCIYVAMYVAGLAGARSLIWFAALLVNTGILFIGVR